jgi:hypothetical protein
VEQSHTQYLLVYLVEQNDFRLLKQYEMEPVVTSNTLIGRGALETGRFATCATRGMNCC